MTTDLPEPACFVHHHWPIRIFFVPSREIWDRVMADLEVDVEPPKQPGRTTTIGRKGHDDRVFVFLGEQCDDGPMEAVMGVMAHEIVHVIQAVEEAIGGRLGDEPEAYLAQALMVWLIDEYRKAGRGWAADAPGGPA